MNTMAAKKNVKRPKLSPLPKGFVPARASLDGFFEREIGNTVTGKLRGVFEVKGKFGPKKVFRIEVTDGETRVGEGEMIGPGGIIGLDSTGYTRALEDLDPGTIVYVKYEGKDGEDEKSPHIFAVGRLEV
jgi:hypothetical protein